MNPFTQITPQQARTLEHQLIWVLPAFAVPLVRFFQDKPHERFRLFVRDFSSLSIGAGIYLGVNRLVNSVLRHSQPEHIIQLAGIAAGIGANIFFQGLGAVKLSQKLDALLSQNNIKTPSADTIHLRKTRLDVKSSTHGLLSLQNLMFTASNVAAKSSNSRTQLLRPQYHNSQPPLLKFSM